jgi:hypothetical protein
MPARAKRYPPALTVPRGIRRRKYKNHTFTIPAHRARLARYLVTPNTLSVTSDYTLRRVWDWVLLGVESRSGSSTPKCSPMTWWAR